jgi:hypothetical protein
LIGFLSEKEVGIGLGLSLDILPHVHDPGLTMALETKRKGSRSQSPEAPAKRGRWEDNLSPPPAECSPSASGSALISGVSSAQIYGGTFSVVGRDTVTINNYDHGHQVFSVDVLDILNSLSLPNFRDIQQDTIAKATEGTCLWIKTEEFFVFWMSQGKILWGFGIRESSAFFTLR